MEGLKSVIFVDPEKCVNCHRCIAACDHDARKGIDDFSDFMNALKRHENVLAIVAPAVAANFRGKDLELNGWLKSIGVKAVFDVSFWAELTTKSYVEHLKMNNPKLVISQPCPALVSWIKNFYPQYKGYKMAAISPCYAKRHEFDENGLGDYNVTMASISAYFEANNIDLSKYPKTPYDNPPAERAVLYSTPGGLLRTAERFVPGISQKTRKIEGQPTMTEYFTELAATLKKGRNSNFQLIDCLNCERGCNCGAGTINQKMTLDELESFIESRSEERKKMLKTESRLGQKKLEKL